MQPAGLTDGTRHTHVSQGIEKACYIARRISGGKSEGPAPENTNQTGAGWPMVAGPGCAVPLMLAAGDGWPLLPAQELSAPLRVMAGDIWLALVA